MAGEDKATEEADSHDVDFGGKVYNKQEVTQQLKKLRSGRLARSLDPFDDFPAPVMVEREILRRETIPFAVKELVKEPDDVDLDGLSDEAAHWYAVHLKCAGEEIPEEVFEKADNYSRVRLSRSRDDYFKTGTPVRETFYGPFQTRDANHGAMLLRRLRSLYKHGLDTGWEDKDGELGFALEAKSSAKAKSRSERRKKRAATIKKMREAKKVRRELAFDGGETGSKEEESDGNVDGGASDAVGDADDAPPVSSKAKVPDDDLLASSEDDYDAEGFHKITRAALQKRLVEDLRVVEEIVRRVENGETVNAEERRQQEEKAAETVAEWELAEARAGHRRAAARLAEYRASVDAKDGKASNVFTRLARQRKESETEEYKAMRAAIRAHEEARSALGELRAKHARKELERARARHRAQMDAARGSRDPVTQGRGETAPPVDTSHEEKEAPAQTGATNATPPPVDTPHEEEETPAHTGTTTATPPPEETEELADEPTGDTRDGSTVAERKDAEEKEEGLAYLSCHGETDEKEEEAKDGEATEATGGGGPALFERAYGWAWIWKNQQTN